MADMETNHVTEKVYCYDHPSAYHNDNALIGAIMSASNNCSKTDPMTLAAMMNQNNQNEWMNNPFAYMMFIWMFRMFNNGWGESNATTVAGENYNSRQIAALQDSINTNHNNDLVIQAINGNRDAMGQLAQTFNTDVTAIQQGICGIKSAIEQVGGAVGYTAEGVKNAIALGDRDIIQQMCNCCCQQKELILQTGNGIQREILNGNYQNQLATERQTNVLSSQMAANHSADQLQDCQNHGSLMSRIDQLANGIQTGFAQIGFNQQQNTQAIINNATQNTQRILDQMCANTTQQLRDSIAEKDRQLQTANIIAGMKASGCGCGCNC